MKKVAFVILVLGCLLVVVSAAKSSILNEDSDGDGLPTVVELQVGTNPNDPNSCITIEGVSLVNESETLIEIAGNNTTVIGV